MTPERGQPLAPEGPPAERERPSAPVSGLLAHLARLPRAARIALWVIGTRLWVWLAMIAGTYFPKKVPSYWAGHSGHFFWRLVPIRALDVWGRWDTDFYVGIARDGYPLRQPWDQWVYNAAYFPLLPTLMRGLSILLGGVNVFYCGILIANAMLVLAVIYLDKLARLDRSPELAELLLACLLSYCGSHFFSCVYPESTALFLGAFALYCARTGRTLAAGLACGLAAVTRSSGILISLPVLYELSLREDGRLRPSWKVLALAFVPLTVSLLMGLDWQLYGDPLYFVHVQGGWGRKPTFPLLSLFRPTGLSLDFHLFALAVLAVVIVGLRRHERPSYLLLAGANVLLPLSTGILNGIYRYMGSNFPLFFILTGVLKDRPRWRRAYLAAGLLTLGLFSFKWGQGFQPN